MQEVSPNDASHSNDLWQTLPGKQAFIYTVPVHET